jgi:diguanylate cyclase (GGDEF)-like protein
MTVTSSSGGTRQPGMVAIVHVAALASAAGVAVVTARFASWRIGPLLVIATFTIVSGLTYVETGSTKLKVSGSFLGLMLAAVLLGGGPAALIGAVTIGFVWLRSREAPHYFRNNLVTYTWFPLVGGLVFYALIRLTGTGPRAVEYYLAVFVAFVVALAVNFLGVAGYQCYLDGSSLAQKAREALVPVLAAELFSALLTMAAVYMAVHMGTVGIVLLALMLVVFQYLVGELLTSKRRGDELHRVATTLRRVATTDELTGLPNREYFRTRLAERIAAAERAGSTFAVMLIDLDRFKEINDTLGHHYGDELLRELGPRLAASVGPAGLVARLGGDEFAVLPGGTADPKRLEEVATRLLACIKQPMVLDEMTLEVGGSIGISRYPADGDDTHALLRRADVAMYASKAAQSGWKRYAPELDHHSMRRLSVLGDFRRALAADEIVVHYQPIVELDDTRLRGAEGLVRWNHPQQGLLLPADFIQTVEQTELIGPLTRHVLERSIAECAQWRAAGHPLTVAVNLSVRNLLDRNLPREIERLLAVYHLPADALQLEITESMLMSDPDRARAVVMRLSDLGVRLSVDDFGTGYSSLANLKALPIDELKIDRSFVSPMLREESDLIIVRSTINLGHDLGLRVIAEGVEDAPTLKRLAGLGCDLAQGYHLSRPMAPDAFTDWMQWPRRHSAEVEAFSATLPSARPAPEPPEHNSPRAIDDLPDEIAV